ncbi:MAG: GDSL-type esterase/lipase family protein [Cyanobacteria bacterium P01_A01_bin.17]
MALSQQKKSFLFALGLVLSFLYGIITAEYKIFPYKNLRAIKKTVAPEPALSHAKKSNASNIYLQRQSFFSLHGQPHNIVMVGDSITGRAEWVDLFPSLSIANRGIDGDTAEGILARLDSIYSTKAQKAFIQVGVNDFSLGVPVSEVQANYKEIVMRCKERGMKVYIQSTILAGAKYAEINSKILALNTFLKRLADGTEGVTYIDLNQRLAKDNSLDVQFSPDGIHLNGAGYKVWKDIIYDEMMSHS